MLIADFDWQYVVEMTTLELEGIRMNVTNVLMNMENQNFADDYIDEDLLVLRLLLLLVVVDLIDLFEE